VKGNDSVQEKTSLPGLERLMGVLEALRSVLQEQGISIEVEPPSSPALAAGERVAGLPLDPLLATVHAHVGYIALREGFILLRTRDVRGFDFFTVNEEWRRDWPEPIRSLLVFGKEDMLAYYYATVSHLADEKGRQPVVRVSVHEEPHAVPIASDMDCFLDTYSRYLEALVRAPDYKEEGSAALGFPWDVPEIIARDRPLVEMLRAGRFDFLMKKEESIQAWVASVLVARV
jgi:hypothetical protein